MLASILSATCTECQISTDTSTSPSNVKLTSITATQLDIKSSVLGKQTVNIYIEDMNADLILIYDPETDLFSYGSASVMRVLEINVVKTFNPRHPLDIFMDKGDAFSINLNADPDASCYEVVPLSIISNGGNSITLTPSASTILDITGSQKGIFSVDLQL